MNLLESSGSFLEVQLSCTAGQEAAQHHSRNSVTVDVLPSRPPRNLRLMGSDYGYIIGTVRHFFPVATRGSAAKNHFSPHVLMCHVLHDGK